MGSKHINPGYRALRKGRSSISGQQYLITTICHDRHRWFDNWNCAAATSALIAEPSLWRESRLLCWVLMPDHLHVLAELGDDESLSKLMQRVKAVTARSVSQSMACAGPIWMPGFHDRALRRDEEAAAVARYVISNPLRVGLVGDVGEYPFWDAVWLGACTSPI